MTSTTIETLPADPIEVSPAEPVAVPEAAPVQTPPAAEPQTPEAPKWDLEMIRRIPMARWLAIRRALSLSTDQVMSDSFLVMLVCANEHHRAAAKRDDWDRFLAMGMEELSDLFDLDEDADKSS